MFEKRLLALSFLAVIIGAACIAPLPYLMSEKTQTLQPDQPQFSIDFLYAYVGDYWNNNSITANQSYGWVYGLIFKTYPNFSHTTMDADGVFEYYTIDISSEYGIIGNVTCTTHSTRPSFMMGSGSYYYFRPDQWFDVNSTWDSNGFAGDANGTGIITANGRGESWNRTAGKPETLTITLRRIGWVILNNNSTITHVATADVVFQAQLEPYREGFIYNNLFTEEQLSEINPAMPQFKFFNLMGGHGSG